MQAQALLRPFGIDVFCTGKKFLVYNMVSRNLKIKYRRSFLGVFWTLLAPTGMALVYYIVFVKILRIRVPHYLTFILSGLLAWTFFSGTVLEGMESIVANWGLLTKIPIPLQVFPYVCSITNLVTLFLSLPVILATGAVEHVHFGASFVLVPIYFAALFLLAYAFSLILAVAFVYLRDLRHAAGIVMQIWFYGTPVLYDESMVPPGLQWALKVNPVGLIFADFHSIFVRGEWPDRGHLLIEFAWVVVAAGASLLIQKRFAHGLLEKV